MTAQQESVVTPERFAQGIDYKEWMAQIDQNKDRFEENYAATNLNPDDVAAIKALVEKPNGPKKVLVLGEAWCPDVFRGLPVIAKLAEATGLELRIFFRDQNLDIMNEFLNQGEFQSIPTSVFYTGDHTYLGHWIERAKKANEEMPLMREIGNKMRDTSLPEEERAKHEQEYAA